MNWFSGSTPEWVCQVLWAKKAQEITAFDVREVTVLTDFVVLCSAPTRISVRALTDELRRRAKRKRLRVLNVDGREEGTWVVVDMGDIMVHLFEKRTREYYQLERIWGEVPRVDYAGPPRRRAAAST